MENALYSDPDLIAVYDAANAGREDFAFYLSRLPEVRQRVLDIGCGTGRFARDLAALGHDVCAVDPAPGMVAYARAQPSAEAIEWITGSCCAVPKTRRFDFAFMTGHAFQCLKADADIIDLFQQVAERLAEDGVFYVESRNPAVRAWDRWRPAFAPPPIALKGGRHVRVVHDVWSEEGEMVCFSETYHFAPEVRRLESRSCLRFACKDNLLELAAAAGLRMQYLFGDWDGGAFDAERSPEIIMGLMPA